MKEFDLLMETTDFLLGPQGCSWDREQTMASTRPCITEEASELVDAIDSENNLHIKEELGDLFFVVVFLCRLAEKENRCTLGEVLEAVRSKLIRRHPHVFGDAKIETTDALLKQWAEIKKQEKANHPRHKSALDSIPKGLPALARAQKVHKKLHDEKFPDIPKHQIREGIDNEENLGKLLYEIVAQAQENGLDAEHALRKTLVQLESAFRNFEV